MKTLDQHDLFALAGYATTPMHKALKDYGDVIFTSAVEITLTDQVEPAGYTPHLSLTAHYQSGEPNNVSAIVKRIVAHDDRLRPAIAHMPLQRIVRTREEVDAAVAYLRENCATIREAIADLDNAILEAGDPALDSDQL